MFLYRTTELGSIAVPRFGYFVLAFAQPGIGNLAEL